LPLGPEVRETATVSLSIPPCKASLHSLPKDIFFGPALTTNFFTVWWFLHSPLSLVFPPKHCNNIPCLYIKIKTFTHHMFMKIRHKHTQRDKEIEIETEGGGGGGGRKLAEKRGCWGKARGLEMERRGDIFLVIRLLGKVQAWRL